MRIQVEFDECSISLIETLKEKTGASTYKELFNNALTILSWAAEQRASGRIITALDEEKDEFRELRMPVLDYAARVAWAKKSAA